MIVDDVRVTHASCHRPSLRFKARDTFCPIGPFVRLDAIGSLDALGLSVSIDSEVVKRASTAGLLRPAARLLAEVSAFMTLAPGDVFSVGVTASECRPSRADRDRRVRAARQPARRRGDRGMTRHAHVAFAGAIHAAIEHAGGVQFADDRVLAEWQGVWLPPFEPGTIIALDIKHPAHAQELTGAPTTTSSDEPLAFLNPPNTLVGHRGITRRPHDLTVICANIDARARL